ncbi:CRP-like cAMP-binding protein [Mumia flava]|uniref:CRP-like cAMP-binding protein n=1 Tax=Mumia flava TaxID=1348852 RepID=A0A0B2BLJ6_9ACTN|nr:CRP-like cAMP-binding protein [Mumia flava]
MDWAVLASLADDERQRVLASARHRRYARGEAVVREGDRADSLHLVARGRFAVRASNSEGDSAILNVLGPGSYFGELALMPGAAQERTATVLALEPAETLALSASTFGGLRQRHPGIERLLTVLLARRVEELSVRLVEAMYEGLDRRVHRRLDELCRLYAAGPGPVTVPLTQSDLAQLVGGARPSVNQVLRRLEERGVVALRRGAIDVTDPAALRRLAHR